MNEERIDRGLDDDTVALERFACGEMTGDEEALFLAQCEIEPERWRAAMLACVEHRRLVAALARCSATTRAASRPSGAVRGHRRSQVAALAAGIACIACGMVAGYRLGRNHAVPQEAVAIDAPVERPAADDRVAGAERSIDAVQALLPPPARQVLEEAGIEVREEPVFYLVDGRDGDRWMIPETQIELRVREGPRPSP